MTTKMDTGLLCCPMCGCVEVEGDSETGTTPMIAAPLWGIVCTYCDYTVRANTVAEARHLWNSRVIDETA